MSHAAQYRDRAEELRTIAEGMRDARVREDLMMLAAQYERLAAREEESEARPKAGAS